MWFWSYVAGVVWLASLVTFSLWMTSENVDFSSVFHHIWDQIMIWCFLPLAVNASDCSFALRCTGCIYRAHCVYLVLSILWLLSWVIHSSVGQNFPLDVLITSTVHLHKTAHSQHLLTCLLCTVISFWICWDIHRQYGRVAVKENIYQSLGLFLEQASDRVGGLPCVRHSFIYVLWFNKTISGINTSFLTDDLKSFNSSEEQGWLHKLQVFYDCSVQCRLATVDSDYICN